MRVQPLLSVRIASGNNSPLRRINLAFLAATTLLSCAALAAGDEDDVLAEAASKCRKLGLPDASPAFAQCVTNFYPLVARQRESEQRQQRQYWCRISTPSMANFCAEGSNAPKVTNCSRDMLGNVTCVTR